jgi:sugar phosphate isomerase/epimerase
MKLGLNSAVLADLSFEELVNFAALNNLECLEVCCWPKGKAERRYAGVSHIDVSDLSEDKVEYIKNYCSEKGVEISALGYYPNTLDEDLEKRKVYVDHLYKLIDASSKLGVNMITTFLGRVPGKTVEENLEIVKTVASNCKYAEKRQVKIALNANVITNDQCQVDNLMTTPAIWRYLNA